MVDVLNCIIDLNTAIPENNLDQAKEAISNINNNLEELRERFGIEDDDIGSYFGLYEVIINSMNDTGLYTIDNLNGLKESLKARAKWLITSYKVIDEHDSDKMVAYVKDAIANGELQDYQYATLIRMINICQEYGLLVLLKKGDN